MAEYRKKEEKRRNKKEEEKKKEKKKEEKKKKEEEKRRKKEKEKKGHACKPLTLCNAFVITSKRTGGWRRSKSNQSVRQNLKGHVSWKWAEHVKLYFVKLYSDPQEFKTERESLLTLLAKSGAS